MIIGGDYDAWSLARDAMTGQARVAVADEYGRPPFPIAMTLMRIDEGAMVLLERLTLRSERFAA
jgi:hypothetical protein